MLTTTYRYQFARAQVWRGLFDTERWRLDWIGVLEDTCGRRFRVSHYPILGTRYSGVYDLEVAKMIPNHECILYPKALALYGESTQWRFTFNLTDVHGGTAVTTTISGGNTADRDDRVLLYMLAGLQNQALNTLDTDLQSGAVAYERGGPQTTQVGPR
ncbi:hypothetical protein AWB85_15500 [Mycobacteroides immunogenum]|uniref:Polyketide cyclase n=1 Tax=Mycobacteroides immunogenum TaxID=83262 RepID=A0A179V5M7_9MYCO|nr:hypothetical protein [Mycobacteroides immunogenum]OAT67014.1 hypothetical protein AWB85_15500 [Mycobacteroides immunogenum]